MNPGIVPAEVVQRRRMVERMRSINEVEPTAARARSVRRHADAVAEWGAVDGALRFYRATSLLMICRERNGEVDGMFEYMTPGAMAVEWSEIVGVAWKLRGMAAVKLDGSWREQKRG